MIKTPLSTVIGGAFWTPKATILGGTSKKTFDQIIKSLFANGEQGFAYDPNDLSTMWQDQAKFLPVTGAGQPVWHILDKSGNNNHAFATSSATRPILRKNATTGAYYLAFDGTDDFLVTSSIDFTATDKISLFAGVRKLSDASLGMLVELSFDATVNNGFYIATPSSAGAPAYRLATGSPSAHALSTSTFPAPASNVLAASYDKSKSTVLASTKLRVNGTQNALTVAIEGDSLGAFSNSPIYIGRRGGTSLPFNGHIYSLIGVGRLATDAETIALEKAIAKMSG